MKRKVITLFAFLALAIGSLAFTSCATESNTHEMGPPNRAQPMSDNVMPERS